jgi:hypothetical protein
MILFHSEHGYSRLIETIVILQVAPPEFWFLGSLVWYVGED